MRAKKNTLPSTSEQIEEAFIENYVDDTDIADFNLNRNTAIAAKKIRD